MIETLTKFETWIGTVFQETASLESISQKDVHEGVKAIKNDLDRILKKNDPADCITSAVAQTSTLIRSLLTRIGEAQMDLCGSEISASNRRILRDRLGKEKFNLLDVLKEELVALALYLERVYTAYLHCPPLGTTQKVYSDYLREKKQVSPAISNQLERNKMDVEVMLEKGTFEKIRIYIDRAKEIVNALDGNTSKSDAERRNDGLLQIQALENLKCFRHFFPDEQSVQTFDDLLDSSRMKDAGDEIYGLLQRDVYNNPAIKKPLHALTDQEQILQEMVKTNLNIDEKLYKESLPRRMLLWLRDERIAIEKNMHLTEEQQERLNYKKIKTSVSVEELATFFWLLDQEGIIKVENKSDLARTVTYTFSSKGADNISANSFYNHYNEMQSKKWQSRFRNLLNKTRP